MLKFPSFLGLTLCCPKSKYLKMRIDEGFLVQVDDEQNRSEEDWEQFF